MEFLRNNLGTVAVFAVVVLLVVGSILVIRRDKRRGGGCSGGCVGCPLKGKCHKK